MIHQKKQANYHRKAKCLGEMMKSTKQDEKRLLKELFSAYNNEITWNVQKALFS